MRPSEAMVGISGYLIADVRTAFELSLQYVAAGRGVKHGVNAYTPHAFSAYVSAVASIEAFLNETFLGPMCRSVYHTSALWDLDQDALQKMDLLIKVVLVPQLLVGVRFRRDAQPFQDFALLVRVRNDIVHYKMKSRAPKYLADLTQRGIAITSAIAGADYPWPWKLSCTEGIRWAHNTACKSAQQLADFIPMEHKAFLALHAANYTEITESFVRGWFREHAESKKDA